MVLIILNTFWPRHCVNFLRRVNTLHMWMLRSDNQALHGILRQDSCTGLSEKRSTRSVLCKHNSRRGMLKLAVGEGLTEDIGLGTPFTAA